MAICISLFLLAGFAFESLMQAVARSSFGSGWNPNLLAVVSFVLFDLSRVALLIVAVLWTRTRNRRFAFELFNLPVLSVFLGTSGNRDQLAGALPQSAAPLYVSLGTWAFWLGIAGIVLAVIYAWGRRTVHR